MQSIDPRMASCILFNIKTDNSLIKTTWIGLCFTYYLVNVKLPDNFRKYPSHLSIMFGFEIVKFPPENDKE